MTTDRAAPAAPDDVADAIARVVFSDLRARCDRLEGVIAEHNKRCERECETSDCTNPCFDCPRRYMIEAPK